MIKKLALATAMCSLALTGVAGAATTGGDTTAGATAGSNSGGTLPGYPGAQQKRVTGVVVDYLSYITRSGTRGELYTGNNNGGGNGGANVGANGGANGGGANANGGGGNAGGGANGGNVMRPLGIISNGHIYMIDLPASHEGLDRRLDESIGRTITVMGRVFDRAGDSVIVVDAIV